MRWAAALLVPFLQRKELDFMGLRDRLRIMWHLSDRAGITPDLLTSVLWCFPSVVRPQLCFWDSNQYCEASFYTRWHFLSSIIAG